MRLIAPAKVNWTLEVLGRREDGYHEVSTVMQTIDLCDEVRLEPAATLTLSAEGPHAPAEDGPSTSLRAEALEAEGSGQDLALQAARLLAKAVNRPPTVSIGLTKRIPAAAGLAGGSSDAAAVLRGLNKMWDLNLGRAQLTDIAARLGSDVPFFLYGGTALAQGRGERITPLPDPPSTWLVLLVPPFSLPEKTKRMYGALSPADPSGGSPSETSESARRTGQAFSDGSYTAALVRRIREGRPIEEDHLHNAFERVAYQTFPRLAAYRDALLAAGARGVHLAGSGPALFTLASSEEAKRLSGRLRAPDGQVLVARTLAAREAMTLQE